MPQIEELATSTRAPAPGWSYVLDTGPRPDPSKAAINPSAQKRRRLAATAPSSLAHTDSDTDGGGAPEDPTSSSWSNGFGRELTLRQQAEIKRHLADLERDSAKEVAIVVPRSKREREGKQSVGVKKVLGSGKTFAHYLEEEAASLRLGGKGREGEGERRANKTPLARRRAGWDRTEEKEKEKEKSEGTVAPAPAPTFLPGTILAQPVPVAISEEEIEALISTPQLTYTEARSKPPDDVVAGMRRRHRVFCEICGYWGRVRCMKCGARICGTECRDTHDESRCLKFYA